MGNIHESTVQHQRDEALAPLILAGVEAHVWLRCAVVALCGKARRGDPRKGAFEQVAAWGLAARLGMPAGVNTVEAMLEQKHPATAALAWLAERPEALSEALSDAVHHAGMLRLFVAGGNLTLDALHLRDDIESVLYVARSAGADTAALQRALDGIDADVRSGGRKVPRFVDDRLGCISWVQPDAWWGAFRGRAR
jgi:hypothetical protein